MPIRWGGSGPVGIAADVLLGDVDPGELPGALLELEGGGEGDILGEGVLVVGQGKLPHQHPVTGPGDLPAEDRVFLLNPVPLAEPVEAVVRRRIAAEAERLPQRFDRRFAPFGKGGAVFI